MRAIESLGASIEQHVLYIHQTAASSPAGGGPAWDALLRHYGVLAFGPEERSTSVRCMRLTRGALPSEVRAALEGLRSWATRELERLRADPSFAANGAPAQLQQRLVSLVDLETQRYENAIGVAPSQARAAPAPGPAAPSLASIFANAQQTSKEVPWANVKYEQVGALTCVHCGGPQERPLDFMCKYCRRPIAGALNPTT